MAALRCRRAAAILARKAILSARASASPASSWPTVPGRGGGSGGGGGGGGGGSGAKGSSCCISAMRACISAIRLRTSSPRPRTPASSIDSIRCISRIICCRRSRRSSTAARKSASASASWGGWRSGFSPRASSAARCRSRYSRRASSRTRRTSSRRRMYSARCSARLRAASACARATSAACLARRSAAVTSSSVACSSAQCASPAAVAVGTQRGHISMDGANQPHCGHALLTGAEEPGRRSPWWARRSLHASSSTGPYEHRPHIRPLGTRSASSDPSASTFSTLRAIGSSVLPSRYALKAPSLACCAMSRSEKASALHPYPRSGQQHAPASASRAAASPETLAVSAFAAMYETP
mmetsp:Transcript_37520/g.120974  ORF Transcript_37520/g.120974 Transcript_37520/m.120974 type:complete len:354 (+) Transcript_37520:836-1897(+)